MTQHTIKLSEPSASIAECKWCNGGCVYTENETWTHDPDDVYGPARDHAAEPIFVVVAEPHKPFDVGDDMIIEAVDGTWLAEVYDTSGDCMVAYCEVV